MLKGLIISLYFFDFQSKAFEHYKTLVKMLHFSTVYNIKHISYATDHNIYIMCKYDPY